MIISRPSTTTVPPLCSEMGLKYGYTPASIAPPARVKEKALSKMSPACAISSRSCLCKRVRSRFALSDKYASVSSGTD